MSFILDWFTNILSYLGFRRKQAKLVFLGLENAGKTTLLRLLKDNKMIQPCPSAYPTKEELTIEGVTFLTYDLGGHETARKIWKDYYPTVDAIVFLIDAQDRKTLQISKEELDGLLADEQIVDIPVLILGNKIDVPDAISEEELKMTFELQRLVTGKVDIPRKYLQRRPLEVYMCSLLKREGYGEGFRWLARYI